jgi:DNA polymerase III gamma/tau subunit
MTLDLAKVLKKKASEKQLHNLYLVEPNGIDESQKTIEWTHNLIQSFINESEFPKSIFNHSDILILKKAEENKLYQKSDIEEIFNFLHYKAQEYHRKILIIERADALTESQINKLLKTFEEPPIDLSIFLVNGYKKQLIATLYSRSIQLKVSLINQKEEIKISEPIEKLSFMAFSKRIEEDQWKMNDLMLYLHQKIENSPMNFSQAHKIKELLKELDETMIFNNSLNSQLFKIFQCLQSIS